MDGIKRNVPTITKATHGTNIKTKSKRIPKTDATREIVAPPFPSFVCCVISFALLVICGKVRSGFGFFSIISFINGILEAIL